MKTSIKEIEREIKWYRIRNSVANAMRELGELGFEFSGHGFGFGGEDFNLMNEKKDMYVNFCVIQRRCDVSVYSLTDNDLLFKGTIGKSLSYIKNHA